jgi:GT2 family glycosyltransferase
MPEVAVLVLNWNGQRWLEPCLTSLRAQTGVDFETWVVDNGSGDRSVEFVHERFPEVRTLSLGVNLGFGAAYNRASKTVDAPLLAFLNNDTVVLAGWLESLVGDLRRNTDTAAAGSKLLIMGRRDVINHAGGQLTPLGAAYDVGFGAVDAPEYDRPGITGCATGAAMLVRRDAFEQAGGFDERYFAYFEDADLCWRFWERGYSVRYQPSARVLHAYGGSTGFGRLSTFRIQHCQTNRLQNMAKHLEVSTLAWAVPASLAYDSLRVVEALRRRQAGAARAILYGSARFRKILPGVLAERRRIQACRTRSDADLFRLGVLARLRESAHEWRRLGGLSGALAA